MADPPVDPPKDPPADPPADPPKDPPADTGKVTFTPAQQAHIDGLIAKNTGKAKTAAEKDFKTWLDQQAMSETDRAKAESEGKDKLVEAAKLEVLTTKIETKAQNAALTAGVKPDRVEKFLKLVDLDVGKLSDDGKPDGDAIKALIEAELKDSPEFKASAGSNDKPGASGGEFNGSGDKHQWTRAELAKLSTAEFEKHEAEIMAQMKAGTIK